MKYKHLCFTLFILFINSVNLSAQSGIITTIAGNGIAGYSGDGGAATAAELNGPWCMAVDKVGNIYVGEYTNHCIRKIDTAGIISTIAGNGTAGFTGDDGPATAAELYFPGSIAFDKNGDLYIADYSANRVRKINKVGIITTFAGNGGLGHSGDGGPATAAHFTAPIGVACDSIGNVYISDDHNNCIRKVNSAGIITTIAGDTTSGFSGDGGPATAAMLSEPFGLKLDRFGNLYVVDESNNCVRKISLSGIITTIAGTTTAGYSGDGGQATAAELYYPDALDVDSCGNLFIADNANDVVREVNASGIITTIAGNTTNGYSGDNGPATDAQLNNPTDCALDNNGNLFIVDWVNNCIRKVNNVGCKGIFYSSNTTVVHSLTNLKQLTLFPNPNNGSFSIKGVIPLGDDQQVFVDVLNFIGQSLYSNVVRTVDGNINISIQLDLNIPCGLYTVVLRSANSFEHRSFTLVK